MMYNSLCVGAELRESRFNHLINHKMFILQYCYNRSICVTYQSMRSRKLERRTITGSGPAFSFYGHCFSSNFRPNYLYESKDTQQYKFGGVKSYQADLATERKRHLTTARANQRSGLTNSRAANWAPEVAFSPFPSPTDVSVLLLLQLPIIKEKSPLPVNVRRLKAPLLQLPIGFFVLSFCGRRRKEEATVVPSHLGRTSSIIDCSRLRQWRNAEVKGTRKVGSATVRAGKKKKKKAALSPASFLPFYFFHVRAFSIRLIQLILLNQSDMLIQQQNGNFS